MGSSSYTIREVMNKLREYLLVNVSDYKAANGEGLISYMNEVIEELWSEFNLQIEEALVVVPDNDTKLFKLATKNNPYSLDLTDEERYESADKNVILGVLTQKLNKSLNDTAENEFATQLKQNEGLV